MSLKDFFLARRDSQDDGRSLPGIAPSTQQVRRELGFDPDSPDLGDPQIDPPWPARIPQAGRTPAKRAPGEQYPPYGG
ncbi:DUF6021 family protein [Pseudomonas sp. Gutcm_11s]|uniref:DUF6021 family protein n=1 Tax=Pseudomonas sp. Gutcm_11s TaxID=3026088 RepID=UPI002362FF70|nr:DUF6021 family protein [Pseudomonas sp. Gutcm_11s]MDD0841602.1 DUF6021 family protein [Pseudomonas sp. Gutcm_11s]